MIFSSKLYSINSYDALPSIRFDTKAFCYLSYLISFLLPFLPTFTQLTVPLQLCSIFVLFYFLSTKRFGIPNLMCATVCIPSILFLIWLVSDHYILFYSNEFIKILFGYFGFIPIYLFFSFILIGYPYDLRLNYCRTLVRLQLFSIFIMSSINFFLPKNLIFSHFQNMDISSFNYSNYYGFAGRPTISSGLILCLFILSINFRDRSRKIPLFDKCLFFFLSCFLLFLKSGFSIIMIFLYFLTAFLRNNRQFLVFNKKKLLYFSIIFVFILTSCFTFFYSKMLDMNFINNVSYFEFLFGLKILAISNVSTPLIFPNLSSFSGFGQDFALFYFSENLSILFALVFFSLVLLNCSFHNSFVIVVVLASLFHYSIILGPSLCPFLGFFLSFRWVNFRAPRKIDVALDRGLV